MILEVLLYFLKENIVYESDIYCILQRFNINKNITLRLKNTKNNFIRQYKIVYMSFLKN